MAVRSSLLAAAFALSCTAAYAGTPYDIHDENQPLAGPHLASPINRGTGVKASRPILKASDAGFYRDTTIGKTIYWYGAKGHWYDANGTQVAD